MNIWVNLPYATFGVEVRGTRVVDAAPIGRWMVGKEWFFCTEWIAKKNGIWKPL